MKVGGLLKIWAIDEVIEKEIVVEKEEFFIMVERVQQMRDEGAQGEKINEEDIPSHLLWKHKEWGKIDRQKIADLQLKTDLNTDRVIA